MTTLLAPTTDEITLDSMALRRLIETLGAEVVGESSFDRLIATFRSGRLTDRPGTAYLGSLLELAA